MNIYGGDAFMIGVLVITVLIFIMDSYHDRKIREYCQEYRTMNRVRVVVLLLIIIATATHTYLTDSVALAIKNRGMQAIAYDADHFISEDSQVLEGDYLILPDGACLIT